MGLCSWARIGKCGGLGTRRNAACQPHASVMESAQLQGNSSPPRTLYGGCPHQHATSQFPLTGSRINTWLISHNIQDLRMGARGMPVPMERLLLGGERFRGLSCSWLAPGWLSGNWSDSATEQQAVISLPLFICSPLHWMPLAASRGLNGKAEENKWGRWESTLNNFLRWIQMNLF